MRDLHIVDPSYQACTSSNELSMNLVFRIELNGMRGSLGQRPERSSLLCHLIKWIDMKQLLDVIEEVLLELSSG